MSGKVLLVASGPYDVRHSFAVRVILETRDVFAARELMLHADIKTTLQYLDAAVSPSATSTETPSSSRATSLTFSSRAKAS